MRTGILADIHSNVVALDAVLEHAAGEDIGRWFCLGDVIGYGPDPGPCLARLREIGAVSVQGNHEAAYLGLETGPFNRIADAAIQYCRRILTPEERSQVEEFADTLSEGTDLGFVHGSIFDRDEYLFQRSQMVATLSAQPTWITFFGHTHQQLLFDGETLVGGPASVELDRGERYIVNPGSVGQPRDGDPRAAYAWIDTETDELELLRVAYDVQEVVRRVENVGLPSYLGERLFQGR